MSKYIITVDGDSVVAERETKVLTLDSVYRGDYYNSSEHDNIYFVDDDGIEWCYFSPSTPFESLTVIGKEMTIAEKGSKHRISGYFVKSASFNQIFNPRLLT